MRSCLSSPKYSQLTEKRKSSGNILCCLSFLVVWSFLLIVLWLVSCLDQKNICNYVLCMWVSIFVILSVSLLLVIPPEWGIMVQLHSHACVGTLWLCLPRWTLLWSWKFSLSYLAASSLEARGGTCESPQQHGYTLESLRQCEACPRGYRQRGVHLCSPTHFLLYFPFFLCSWLSPV